MSEINLLIAQPNEKGWVGELCKKYVKGEKAKSYFPTYFDVRPIHFDTLTSLAEKLEPYIQGTHKDAYYSAVIMGDFDEYQKTPYGHLRRNLYDTPRDYMIIDIETDLPRYEEISLNLETVYHWLIEEYDWLQENNGIFLHFSGSAGVVNKAQTHKQIRIRAIVKLTNVATSNDRQNRLRAYMKVASNHPDIEHNNTHHIDMATHQHHRLFYLSPPKLTDTQSLIKGKRWFVKEGDPIDITDFATLEDKASFSSACDPRLVKVRANQEIMDKTLDDWFALLAPGNSFEIIWRILYKAMLENKLDEYYKKIQQVEWLGKDRDSNFLDYVIKRITEIYPIKIGEPFEPYNHNVIQVGQYRLDHWLEKDKKEINWVYEDKHTILCKLYEGAGKTTALKDLRAKYPDKSFLYIAPNITPVRNASKDLELTYYQDIDKTKYRTEDHLGLCYPSIHHLQIQDQNGNNRTRTYDIIVLDEIEQILTLGSLKNGIIRNPSWQNDALVQLIENAELVVGLDARISNLSLYMLEHFRRDQTFDIYTHDTVKPFKDHTFTFTSDLPAFLNGVIEKVRAGERVAIVSELDGKLTRRWNLEQAKNYVEEVTGVKGVCIWAKNKEQPLHNEILNDLSDPDHMGKLEKLIGETSDNAIGHIWLSPVVQSSWSYVANKHEFTHIFGLYPDNTLTAPNIIQHLKRFRQTKNYTLLVSSHYQYFAPDTVMKQLYPTVELQKEEEDKYSVNPINELNRRATGVIKREEIMLNHRLDHLIEIIRARGGKIEDDLGKAEKEIKDATHQHFTKAYNELLKAIQAPEAWDNAEKVWNDNKLTKQYIEENYAGTLSIEKRLEKQYWHGWFELVKEEANTEDYALQIVYDIRFHPTDNYLIRSQKELNEDLLKHYFIKEKHLSIYYRELFDLNQENRKQDSQNPIIADKDHYERKGDLIDEWCELAGIEKDTNFQIQDKVIFKEDIIGSQWHKDILRYKNLIKRLFRLDNPPQDFEKNPMGYFQQFGEKVLGIVIHRTADSAINNEYAEKLIKDHKRRDIYRRNFGATPRSDYKKLGLSKEYISKIPFADLEDIEQRYIKRHLGHLEIRKEQPRWNGYLSQKAETLIKDFRNDMGVRE